MGRKCHPFGLRLGISVDSKALFYANNSREYVGKMLQERAIRDYIKNKPEYKRAFISDVTIKYSIGDIRVDIHTNKPGMIVGKGGIEIDKLKHYVDNLVNSSEFQKRDKLKVFINVHDVKHFYGNAHLVAQEAAKRIEKRESVKRVRSSLLRNMQRHGVFGAKIQCAGRLNGAEIARTESVMYGDMSTNTLSKVIDYAFVQAYTQYGVIGIRVWINPRKITNKNRKG